jgi:hypothetical protein
MQDIPEVILTELRELRSEYNVNAILTSQRLASLETSMTTLVGNGQPGRIAKMEEDVKTLQGWRWWLVGGCCRHINSGDPDWLDGHPHPALSHFNSDCNDRYFMSYFATSSEVGDKTKPSPPPAAIMKK